MGLRRLLETIVAGSALAIAAAPAWAEMPDGPPMSPPEHGAPMMPGHGAGMHQAAGFMPSPQFRDSWLAECTDRLADGHGRRKARHAEERCVRYFDSYYEYYRMYQPGPGYAQAYGYPGAPMRYGGCCQQPMMMPAAPMTRGEPKCTETVEYEYVDVPVRRRAAPPPTKRVKVVPDKRIKVK